MGRRGPPPKPTALRILEGNPSCRPLPEREPKPPKGAPRRPSWLSAKAGEVWKQVVPQLDAVGVLTKIDGNMLARYCDAFVRWKQAAAFIDKHGEAYPIKNEDGSLRYMQQWPQVAIYHKLAMLLHRMEQEFGMSPASRTRVQVVVEAKDDNFENWIGKSKRKTKAS